MEKTEDPGFRRRVFMRAIAIRRECGCSQRDALVRAELIEFLIARMRYEVVVFCFVGQDGVERHVRGTLQGYERQFKRPYEPKPDGRFVVYFDVEQQGWRTFQASFSGELRVES